MNGLICIYKEANMTSFDVVRQVKRVFHTKKVGHSGTLDPNAEGVLVCAINKATKSLSYLDVYDKVYHAKLKLGLKTHTGDIWGDVLEEQMIQPITSSQVEEVIQSLTGPQKQRVPMVSAKRVNGKRLYQYVLDGEPVETQYTDVEIYRIDLISMSENEIEIRAHVSNGTYIRTLCEDIAKGLNNLGTMTYLVREQIGSFTLEDTIKLEDLSLETELLPVREHLNIPLIEAQQFQKQIMYGQTIELMTQHDQVVVDGGDFYAVYQRVKDNTFKSIRGLW
ncbi:tRNA pseudouridine(55) synthase TruB [Erysipelothrix urinaevulpis]|uniref:tRNA pseudouridine(55) synthase TruB n=1 Tax=Erysipelothrix urinaevulpis TaxID=2683717 RepID=UPI00135895AF|nr:tRNA pseudouridine(55) synthase TruB [Erysipelothrix urinaevulpis]